MIEPLPLRLHRAASFLSRMDDPAATEGQVAIAETAARIARLEDALTRLLDGTPGVAEGARRVLAGE